MSIKSIVSQIYLPCRLRGFADPLRRRAAETRATACRCFGRKHRIYTVRYAGFHLLHHVERQFGKLASALFRERDDAPGCVMGRTERHAELTNKPVGDVCRGWETIAQCRAHGLGIRLEVVDHAGHCGDREAQAIRRIKGRFLVLLHIFSIGKRKPFHYDCKSHEGTKYSTRLRARQFGGVGIPLLRHNRRAGGEGVRETDEGELRGSPYHELLREAREVCRRDRGHRKELE